MKVSATTTAGEVPEHEEGGWHRLALEGLPWHGLGWSILETYAAHALFISCVPRGANQNSEPTQLDANHEDAMTDRTRDVSIRSEKARGAHACGRGRGRGVVLASWSDVLRRA